MKDNPRLFIPLYEAERRTDVKNLLFGSKKIYFADATASKSGRKARRTLNGLQEVGILASDLTVINKALFHGAHSNPTFVKTYSDGQTFFISVQTVSFDGLEPNNQRGITDVITGMCLFGTGSAEGVTKSGQKYNINEINTIATLQEKLTKLEVDPRIHPYEADTILRLSSFINTAFDPENIGVIHFHVPRIEYYLYGLTLYEKGCFDKRLLSEWFIAVDKRAVKMQSLAVKRSRKTMKLVSPLASIQDYVRHVDQPSLDTMQHILRGNRLWQELLDTKPPSSFIDLNNLSYMYTYLQLAQEQGLVIAVENPEESPILAHIKNMNILNKGTIVGLYVHPNVLTQHGRGKERLYYQPSHDKSIQSLIEIFRANVSTDFISIDP